MDFSVLSGFFVMTVVVGCLVVGYIIKHTLKFIPNSYIPAILAAVGIVLNLIVSGVSVESVVYGAVMGLSSTGMHQAFKQYIENAQNKNDGEE